MKCYCCESNIHLPTITAEHHNSKSLPTWLHLCWQNYCKLNTPKVDMPFNVVPPDNTWLIDMVSLETFTHCQEMSH